MPEQFRFLLFLVITFSSYVVKGQKLLEMTKIKSGKKIYLKEGMRVQYFLHGDEMEATTGYLNEISDSSIVVEGEVVEIKDILAINKKKRGSGFWSSFLPALGGTMIGSVIFPRDFDPCPNCQVVSSEDNGGTVGDIIAVSTGIGLVALGTHTTIKNTPNNVTHKWKLKVIDE